MADGGRPFVARRFQHKGRKNRANALFAPVARPAQMVGFPSPHRHRVRKRFVGAVAEAEEDPTRKAALRVTPARGRQTDRQTAKQTEQERGDSERSRAAVTNKHTNTPPVAGTTRGPKQQQQPLLFI